jgi:hypothetical protein
LEFLNPGQEEIFLSFYDISGRLVYRTSVKTDRIEINTGNMMPGLYFFRLSTEISKPFTGKLIIE